MRSSFTRRLLPLLITAIPCCSRVDATDIVVSLVRPKSGLDGLPSKLAPALEIAVQSGGNFSGFNANGDVVLSFRDEFFSDAKKQLASHGMVKNLSTTTTKLAWPGTDLIIIPRDKAEKLQISNEVTASSFVSDNSLLTVHSAGGFTAKVLRELEADHRIRYVQPNYRYNLDEAFDPKDPDYVAGKQWGINRIHAIPAWNSGASTGASTKMIVAVLDSGVDYTHPDLKENIWINPGETGFDASGQDKGTNGKDDDGNGYVDDVYGYDFAYSSPDPMDRNGHGTHCAGTIGAVANNGIGMVGIACHCQLMALKVFKDDGSYTGDLETIKAINYAVANGAKVLSNSWSGPDDSLAMRQAIRNAQQKGVLCVASAGNGFGSDDDAAPRFPGCYAYDNIINVLAVNDKDVLSDFSNIGKMTVHIAAPGELIYSTYKSHSYAEKDGTSMAVPFVAGAAALIWGISPYSELPYFDLRAKLFNNARKLDSLANSCSTGGVLDLDFVNPGMHHAPPTPAAGDPSLHLHTRFAVHPNSEISGIVKTAQRAFGGETTGIILERASTRIELYARDPATLNRLRSLNGAKVTVRGSISTLKGIEVPERRVLSVEEIYESK